LRASLERELSGLAGVVNIRGRGLMLGIELAVACGELLKQAADEGLLISVTADSVIRLVPPLIMTTAEANQVVAILVPLIKQFLYDETHGNSVPVASLINE
jgi:acetylornithine aminotransferase